jgi:hypothetical protein
MEYPNGLPCLLPIWKKQIQEDGARRCVTEEKDATMITWTLAMQECGLFINLQQLKMKVVELT